MPAQVLKIEDGGWVGMGIGIMGGVHRAQQQQGKTEWRREKSHQQQPAEEGVSREKRGASLVRTLSVLAPTGVAETHRGLVVGCVRSAVWLGAAFPVEPATELRFEVDRHRTSQAGEGDPVPGDGCAVEGFTESLAGFRGAQNGPSSNSQCRIALAACLRLIACCHGTCSGTASLRRRRCRRWTFCSVLERPSAHSATPSHEQWTRAGMELLFLLFNFKHTCSAVGSFSILC